MAESREWTLSNRTRTNPIITLDGSYAVERSEESGSLSAHTPDTLFGKTLRPK